MTPFSVGKMGVLCVVWMQICHERMQLNFLSCSAFHSFSSFSCKPSGPLSLGYVTQLSKNYDTQLCHLHSDADHISLAKMQQSLEGSRKLDRLSFVITEASNLLASIILLDGRDHEDIVTATVFLFIVICQQYSINQQTWINYNGDAYKIGTEMPTIGTYSDFKPREPRGLWEKMRGLFGQRFFDDVTRFRKLGVDGLKKLLPPVYQTISDLEAGFVTSTVPDEKILLLLEEMQIDLQPLIEQADHVELATRIGKLLLSLFPLESSPSMSY